MFLPSVPRLYLTICISVFPGRRNKNSLVAQQQNQNLSWNKCRYIPYLKIPFKEFLKRKFLFLQKVYFWSYYSFQSKSTESTNIKLLFICLLIIYVMFIYIRVHTNMHSAKLLHHVVHSFMILDVSFPFWERVQINMLDCITCTNTIPNCDYP